MDVGNLAQESALVDGLLWHLPNEAQDRWKSCRASHRFMAYRGKHLVIFTKDGPQPTIVDNLTCTSVSLSFRGGMESVWTSDRVGAISVGHIPVELATGIFLWHAFSSEVQYKPFKHVYNVRFPLIYRCPHHPKFYSEGSLYIQERASFVLEYPA